MITFFTTAKSFAGEARQRQFNAVRTWKALHPDVEVILFGRGEGYEQAAHELGMILHPDVETNEKGCPRIDSMFAMARRYGRHALKAYLNCDILVLPDLLDAVSKVPFSRYLMIGERWGLSVPSELQTTGDWTRQLREELAQTGLPGRITAIDMFLYRGDFWEDVPPMVIGRAGYDNALVYYCRSRRIPVVDMTGWATLIHQEHGYSHLERGRVEVFKGDEAATNVRLAGGWDYLFTIEDADWKVQPNGVARNYARGDSRRWAVAGRLAASTGWKRALPLVWRELAAEWGMRRQHVLAGQWGPLLKLPLWLARRLIKGGAR